jgi:hypothetical protein
MRRSDLVAVECRSWENVVSELCPRFVHAVAVVRSASSARAGETTLGDVQDISVVGHALAIDADGAVRGAGKFCEPALSARG